MRAGWRACGVQALRAFPLPVWRRCTDRRKCTTASISPPAARPRRATAFSHLAREGERLGLHSAMIADHIVLPVESQSIYPYALDGKRPSVGDALETFSILGVVAGATERLRLVTSVLVLPYRNADREDGLAGRPVR